MRRGWVLWAVLAAGCDCGGSGLVRATPDIIAAPSPLAFGAVYPGLTAGQELTVQNRGGAVLQISSVRVKEGSHPGLWVETAGFSLSPNERRVLVVRLTVTELGAAQGAIVIASDDADTPALEVPIVAEGTVRPGPALSVCVESMDLPLPKTCVDPLALDFGALPLGASLHATVTLRSVGTAALQIFGARPEPGADPAFVFAPNTVTATLAPGEERRLAVAVTPITSAASSAILTVESSDPERSRMPIRFSVQGVDAALCADPPAVDFGATPLAQPVLRSVRLRSCGTVPASLSLLLVRGAPEISIPTPPALPTTLAPGQSLDLELQYLPVDRGSDAARLEIATTGRSLFIPLVGRTIACDLVAVPMGLGFGAVAAGQSRHLMLVLENAGGEVCHVSSLSLTSSAEFALDMPPSTPLLIPPGGAINLSVSYTPADAGMDMGLLDVTSDDPDEPLLSAALSGHRSEVGDCLLSAQPDPVAFGAVALGSIQSMRINVTNTGQSSCTIGGVRMSAGSGLDFSVSGGPMLPLLRPGRSFTLDVSFAPQVTTAQHGEVEILTSLLGSSFTSVQVSGSGAGPRLCIAPSPLVFGTRAPAQAGATRTLSLRSCGSVPVVVSGLAFTAGTSAEYRLPSPPQLPFTLPAGAQTILDVAYVPIDAGRDDGILRVVSSDLIAPSQDVELVGAGGTACGDVQGRICGLGGTGPVSGATVYVDGPGGRVAATTNERGDFILTCLPPGSARVHAQSGNWSTSFNTTVTDGQTTLIPGQQCLDPMSARVAVVWGEWDHIETILGTIGIPYQFYDQSDQDRLLLDPTEMARYNIIFLNCGFNDALLASGAGTRYLQSFVAMGGSLYASDWAYDPVEVIWPSAIDFIGDDTIRDSAQNAGSFAGPVSVLDPTLRAALGGRRLVNISSCCTAIDAAGAGTTTYLDGDRLGDGSVHPFFVGFRPSLGSGTVMYTDFHNNGQADIEEIFRWLIARL